MTFKKLNVSFFLISLFLIVPFSSIYSATNESLFTTQTPASLHNSDGPTTNYELGMKFIPAVNGQITAIRYWKDSSETGTHTGRIWNASGSQLTSVVFSGETASGWQQQALPTPLSVTAGTQYIVTVNTGATYYVFTQNGLQTKITNGNLSSVAGTNGVFGPVGQYPTQAWNSSNYFRDVVFVANDTGTPPSDTTAPTVPTNLSATAVSSSAINLSWTASTDAVGVTGYKVYRGGTQIGTSIGTSYSDTGLSASTQYTYTVSAYDAAGNNSSQSSSVSATTQSAPVSDTTAPTTPTNLSATAVSSSAINLSWTASTDAVGVTGYKIYRGGTQVGTSPSATYSDSGLSASTNYSYTVAAYDAAGNTSSQSSSASATTQAQVSGNCSATNIRCVGSGQEYTTIQAASNASVAGDTIVVYPGTYNERVTISRSGSAGNKITYQGYLPGGTCPKTSVSDINHPTGYRPNPSVTMNGFTTSANYIRIDCFNTNGNGVLNISSNGIHDVDSVNNYSKAGAGGSVGVYINDQAPITSAAQNIYVGYNYVEGGGYGVLQKCINCRFEYNEFYRMNPGTSGADGDYARIFGHDITFYKNYMYGNDRNLCGGTDCHIDCFQTFSYATDVPA